MLFCTSGPLDLRRWTMPSQFGSISLRLVPVCTDQPPLVCHGFSLLVCQSSDESACPVDPVQVSDSKRARVIREASITRSCGTSTKKWMKPPTEAPKADRRNGAGVAKSAAVAAAAATAAIAAMEAMTHRNEYTPPSKARRPPASSPASTEKGLERPMSLAQAFQRGAQKEARTAAVAPPLASPVVSVRRSHKRRLRPPVARPSVAGPPVEGPVVQEGPRSSEEADFDDDEDMMQMFDGLFEASDEERATGSSDTAISCVPPEVEGEDNKTGSAMRHLGPRLRHLGPRS